MCSRIDVCIVSNGNGNGNGNDNNSGNGNGCNNDGCLMVFNG